MVYTIYCYNLSLIYVFIIMKRLNVICPNTFLIINLVK